MTVGVDWGYLAHVYPRQGRPRLCGCEKTLPGQRSSRYTPADVRHMLAWSRHGWALQWIGDRYGISRERVRQIVRANGLQPHPARRMTTTKRYQLWGLRDQGLSCLEISQRLGIPFLKARTTLLGARPKSQPIRPLGERVETLLRDYEISPNGCWVWTGAWGGTSNYPSPQLTLGAGAQGEQISLSPRHLIYKRERCPASTERYMMRMTCRNSRCVNPDHPRVYVQKGKSDLSYNEAIALGREEAA